MQRTTVTATVIALALALAELNPARAALEGKPLPPTEARAQAGKAITVEMMVKSAKDRLDHKGEIYLDSETDFRDKKNFAVVINKSGASSLKSAGIDNPAEHFKNKTIRATGTVKIVDDVPRIVIDSVKNIRIVESSQSQ